MPAAAPIPRIPSLLTCYDAADLLTGPGCPVCRYARESSDRYLNWFALEGHADSVTLTRLCGSLGMCGCHTRRIMGQPGAPVRLTAVYLYLIRSARARLAAPATPLADCPACEHDAAAADRALDTLLDGLAGEATRFRCRELGGGLCIPHLSAAAARGPSLAVRWLADTMTAILLAHDADLAWLTGTIDDDAEVRTVLRRALPLAAAPGSDVCAACLASAYAVRNCVSKLMQSGGNGGPQDPGALLCQAHLGDATTVAASKRQLEWLLLWQADRHTAGLAGRSDPASKINCKALAWLMAARRRQRDSQPCDLCASQEAAAHGAIDDYRQTLRIVPPAPGQRAALCVRHLLTLRACDPWAGRVTARGAVAHADCLIAELGEAFAKNTWQRRNEPKGREAAAWRRSAAFLDGSVFCGSPPRSA
jgi:hypothetical protein